MYSAGHICICHPHPSSSLLISHFYIDFLFYNKTLLPPVCLRDRCQCRVPGAHSAGVKKGVHLGGSHLSLQGACLGGPAPGFREENKAWRLGQSAGCMTIREGVTPFITREPTVPLSSPAKAGTRSSAPASRIGLLPPLSLSPRIMGFKCLI